MDSKRFEQLLLAAIGLPAVIVALVTGVSGIASYVFDRPLILAPVPRNVAEAAGNRDVADVVLLSATSNMNRAEVARVPLRLHAPAMLTPLEAAAVSERPYMINVVRNNGARLDAMELRTLRCIAQARKDRGTIAFLAQMDSTSLICDGVQIPY
jgi:hypothetical protein